MKKLLFIALALFSLDGFSQIITIQSFATGFSAPVEITKANDTRLFVVEQGGLVKILQSNGSINTTPFLNLSSIISTGGERGLLGLAFHPDYANNGYFFVDYTNTSGNTVIARYSVSTNADIATTTGTILMTITQPYSNHNGGSLKFGSDGYLYIGMGDGGSAGDPENRAQNITENLGKILRIDVNSNVSPFYTSPSTNPYVGVAGNDEIWAIGVRNPWKFSFNRLNGDLWIADVGQNAIEEIDKISNPLPNTGLNFGWRCYEGNAPYNTTGCAAIGTMTFPVAQYSHTNGACSITGGYFYTGTAYPNFQNKYFFADYCNSRIGYLDATNTLFWTAPFTGNNFTTFGEDINGELYIGDATNGIVYKLLDSSFSTNLFGKSSFTLYPNPTHNSFSIDSNDAIEVSKVALYDLTGNLLLTKELNNTTNNQISIPTISSGIYLVIIEDLDGNRYYNKLIVNHN